MSVSQKQVQILGISIREDSKGYLCINDLWKASGSNKSKDRPSVWLKRNRTKELLEIVHSSTNTYPVYNYQQGNELLTYSNKKMFLNYAGYLSAHIESAAYDALLSVIKNKQSSLLETENVELKIENQKLKEELTPVIARFASVTQHLKLLGVDKPKIKTTILDMITDKVNHRYVEVPKFDRAIKSGNERDVIISHSDKHYDTVLVSPELVEKCLNELNIEF